MPILDIQRRGQQIGRLRIGQQVPSKTPGKMRPVALETFRFTTGSRYVADAIAELYGGNVAPWGKQWEVITDRDEVDVIVPPRDQVITQWYEWWTAAGCLRRCDSQIEQKSGGPCKCPHADDPTDPVAVEVAARERDRLAKLNPPQACQRKTRINVMIPDLPGLGVFRLDTGSFYAAGEVLDAGDLMQAARDRNVFLPAKVRIDAREQVENGKTKKYPVPLLDILVPFRQIVTGQLEAAGIAGQLPPAPGETRRALTAGQEPAAPTRPALPATVEREPDPQSIAQRIADSASQALSRGQINGLVHQAREAEVISYHVCADTASDTWEELDGYLKDLWHQLPDPSQPDHGDAA